MCQIQTMMKEIDIVSKFSTYIIYVLEVSGVALPLVNLGCCLRPLHMKAPNFFNMNLSNPYKISI